MRSVVPVVLWLSSAPLACTSGAPPPTAPTTVTLAGDAGVGLIAVLAATPDPGDASASNDGGPDYYSCAVDSDCVAVPKAQCCPNGFREAVNKQSVDAYRGSVACGNPRRRICPQYRVFDRRTPICGNESHRCEMVMPDHVTCNGTGPNVHACPSGSQCDPSGHCTASSAPPSTP
jgi:hypothetical protein